MRRAVLLVMIIGTGCGDSSSSEPPLLEPNCPMPASGTNIVMRQIAVTQGSAILVTSPKRDPRRFIVEQDGRIRILDDAGALQPVNQAFLDISETAGGPVVCCGEQGLLGLAFHPRYKENRTFFVFYTTNNQNIVAKYQTRPDDPNHADPASGTVILSIPDFASNHNGGMLEFGPDGYLYIGTGDGGGGGDPQMTGQDPHALLGKILRIDVDGSATGKLYGIPPTNPFADGMAGAAEVFMLGLRNPWRWSFDPITGDLWIGDVGQGEIEELDVVKAGQGAGMNFGWSMYEGSTCYHPPCTAATRTMPVVEKTHGDSWCSIIGGNVYRGGCAPDIVGKYYYTDYCKHELHVATLAADGTVTTEQVTNVTMINMNGAMTNGFPTQPSSFHHDARGELYVTTSPDNGNGAVWHLEAAP